MIPFNLYLHGVPIGHDVWGPEEDSNYLNRFYKDNIEVQENSILQIEIYHGKTFYTYLRKNSVQNAEKRPGSYFGITLSFNGQYCNNVYILFKIFDAVYKQICVGNIISQEGKAERFLVRKFSEANSVLGKINAAFSQQLEKLLSENFSKLDASLKQTGTTKFNLSDVDSPYFLEVFKGQVVLVSPEYISMQDELSSMQRQIQPLKQQIEDLKGTVKDLEQKNRTLGDTNEGSKSRILSLEKDISKLNDLLKKADQNASNRYRLQLENLNSQLADIKKKYEEIVTQKDEYAEEIKKLNKAIAEGNADKELLDLFKQIKEPLNTFVRHSASRFQGGHSNRDNKSEKSGTTLSFKVCKPWINSFLLCCILALSLYSILTPYCANTINNRITNKEYEELLDKYESLRDSVNDVQAHQNNNTEVANDALSTGKTDVDPVLPEHTIDIKEYKGNGPLYVGTVYTLNVNNFNGICVWSVTGKASLNNNKLTINGVGSVTISGKANGISVRSRTISTANRSAVSTQKNDSIKK